MVKEKRKVNSILDSIEPLSEEEKKLFSIENRKRWFNSHIDSFLTLALIDSELRDKFIKVISHPAYESVVRDIKKVKLPPKKKWTTGKYIQYFMHYVMYYMEAEVKGETNPSDIAINQLMIEEGLNNEERARKYLTDARKIAKKYPLLADFSKPFLQPPKRKPQKKDKK